MKILLWIIVSVIVFISIIRYIERSSLYFPMKEMSSDPSFTGLTFEDVYFTTKDNKGLNGWYVPARDAEYTVIFCHGNAGNISHRLEKLKMFNEMDVNTFIFDYRGYGRSEGIPSENGLYEDGRAAYKYVTETLDIPEEKIILYGESIGGAVVIDIAVEKNPAAIITEDALSSVKDVAKIAYPVIPAFVYATRFDSISKIGDVDCDKLIIHSVDDEIIPFRLGKKLYEAAKPPKEFLELRGGHNTAFIDSSEAYISGIKRFIQGLK